MGVFGGVAPMIRGANCVGENVSPAFSWSNAPAGTKSFAFLMVDPEGRNGLGAAGRIGRFRHE